MGSDSIEGRVEGADGREGRITKRDISMGWTLGISLMGVVSLGIMAMDYVQYSASLDRSIRAYSLKVAHEHCNYMRGWANLAKDGRTLVVPTLAGVERYHANKTCDEIYDEFVHGNRNE